MPPTAPAPLALASLAMHDEELMETVVEGREPAEELVRRVIRGLTQGQGTFTMEPLRYECAPRGVQEAIIAERRRS